MKLNRIVYLGYYLKQLDQPKFKRFLRYASEQSGRSKPELMSDVLSSVLRYNISLLEYFQFRFFELTDDERRIWAGTGYMYEFQLKMNPPGERHILDDKRLFHKNYKEFFVHEVADAEELKNREKVEEMLALKSGKLVFKVADGKCGAQVEIRNNSEFTPDTILPFMREKDYGLVEEFINQHPEINRLSPSAVNTVRIITQLNRDGEVEILGCRFRISVDSPVDNMGAGNLAAPIDETSGVVTGPGVYSDITKKECTIHPITGVEIPGFKIPFWNEIIKMINQAALKHPQNRSIGWDVVVTDKGPGLIEGNHDWCKLVWQLPVKKGLKPELEHYLELSHENSPKKRKKSLNNIDHVEAGI